MEYKKAEKLCVILEGLLCRSKEDYCSTTKQDRYTLIDLYECFLADIDEYDRPDVDGCTKIKKHQSSLLNPVWGLVDDY